MNTGILTSWYLSRIKKAKTPVEYFLALQGFILYEANVFNHNLKEYFHHSL